MPEIRAIQTRYAGCHFRSRAEARWAVFFDTLGVTWEYEPEGYSTEAGPYLPDFYLPDLDFFVEVKGTDPTPEEEAKALALAKATGKMVYIFVRAPREPDGHDNNCAYFPDGACDYGHSWCECGNCGKVGVEFAGRLDYLGCCYDTKDFGDDTPNLRRAYAESRAARFRT